MSLDLHSAANYGLLCIVVGCLLTAAVSDLRSYTIPNACSLVLLATFPVAVSLNASLPQIYDNVMVSLVILLLGYGLFVIGKMGAGDVKLLAAVGLWAGLDQIVAVVFAISIMSLLLVLTLIAVRRGITFVSNRWNAIDAGRIPQALRPGENVPLGVAIALGTLVVLPAGDLFVF